MKKKHVFILIGVILLLIIGGTLAWWRWSSQINALIYGEVCAPEIVFVGGTTINGNDLLPVRTKEEGLSKDIKVNLNNTCDNDTAVLNLKLNLETFPSGLSDASFKWAVYKVDTEEVEGTPTETLSFVSSGNFANRVQGGIIDIAEDLVVTENISTYRLYIWIDALMDNPSTIGDNSFIFKLYGEGTGAIYKEYTMNTFAYNTQANTPTDFMVENLSRDSIESIEISNTSNIPEGVTSYDISSNQDGTVKLWYIENPETNLNKVYIGSSNGVVKANTNLNRTFAYLTNAKKIDLTNLDTSSVTNMSVMFSGCTNLEELKIGNLDTSKVTTMASMFYNAGTSDLIINIDNFNTSLVTSMANMFEGCKASTINLSNFSNKRLTSMNKMFNGCKASSIRFNDFNTSNVTDMTALFMNCTSLTDLDVSCFDISNVTTISEWLGKSMFANCSSLKELDLSNFRTNKITDMHSMFQGCTNLESLNISNLDTSKVTNMYRMFKNCSKLKAIDLSSFNTKKVNNGYGMAEMFYSCSSLESLDLSSFNTEAVKSMAFMFQGCTKLKNLDITSFNTRSVTNMNSMFNGCKGLTFLDLSSFVTTSLTSMLGMFKDCSGLISLDLSNLNTSRVTSMNTINYGLFDGCKNLKTINLKGNFSTASINNLAQMFRNCSSLETLDLSNFNTSKVTTMEEMFRGCVKIESINLSSFNTELVKNMAGLFFDCKKLKTVDLSSFRTPLLENTSSMFDSSGIEILDLSTFNTSKVTTMKTMFQNCSNLKTINLSNFNTSKTSNMNRMFINSAVEEVNLSGFTAEASPDIREMFWGSRNLRMLDMRNFDFSHASNTSVFLDNQTTPTANIIVKDCDQYNLFRTKYGTGFTNLHTVNNDNCTV